MSWHNTAKSCGLAVEVNAAVVRRRTASLPGEISTARGRASDSAVRSNALGDGREVSRGHSTEIMNRGAERCPFKQRNSQAQLRKDRTGTITRPQYSPRRRLRQDEPEMEMGCRQNRSEAEIDAEGTRRVSEANQKERLCGVTVPRGEVTIVHYSFVGSETTGTAVLPSTEEIDADRHREAAREERPQSNPYGRWCGGSGFNPRSYPILQALQAKNLSNLLRCSSRPLIAN